jgi:hypothetical protein
MRPKKTLICLNIHDNRLAQFNRNNEIPRHLSASDLIFKFFQNDPQSAIDAVRFSKFSFMRIIEPLNDEPSALFAWNHLTSLTFFKFFSRLTTPF